MQPILTQLERDDKVLYDQISGQANVKVKSFCLEKPKYNVDSLDISNYSNPDFISNSADLISKQVEKIIVAAFAGLKKISPGCENINLKISTKEISESDVKSYCQHYLGMSINDLEFDGSICWICLTKKAIDILHSKANIKK